MTAPRVMVSSFYRHMPRIRADIEANLARPDIGPGSGSDDGPGALVPGLVVVAADPAADLLGLSMDVAHANELLGEIPDDGEIVRRPFAPSPNYIDEGLAKRVREPPW